MVGCSSSGRLFSRSDGLGLTGETEAAFPEGHAGVSHGGAGTSTDSVKVSCVTVTQDLKG